MKIRIICVGRLKEKFYTDAVNEFRKRLGRFAEVEITELADERAPEGLSPAELEQVKAAECSRILEKISREDTVIALDIAGKQLSSPELADKLSYYMLNGRSRLVTGRWAAEGRRCVFVIGGSNGLNDSVLHRADFRLSFSKLTFSHQIFRIMLLEQIYRAFKIMNNEPYHK